MFFFRISGKSDEKSNTSLPSNTISSEVLVSSTVQHQNQLNANSLKAGEELKKKEEETASVLKSVSLHTTETDKPISDLPIKEVDSIKLEGQGEELMDVEQSGMKDPESSEGKCKNGQSRQESEIVNGKEIADIEITKENSGNSVWTTKKEREHLILSNLATEEEQVRTFYCTFNFSLITIVVLGTIIFSYYA